MTDQDIHMIANQLKTQIPLKNEYQAPGFQGVLNLIEASNFGYQPATVEINTPLPPFIGLTDPTNKGMRNMLTSLKITLGFIFCRHGQVTLTPFRKKWYLRSIRLDFVPSQFDGTKKECKKCPIREQCLQKQKVLLKGQ